MPDLLLWDDNPSETDLLGFTDVADAVLEAIRMKHLDPVCVGVFGPWGCGKTTVLGLVQKELESDDSTIVVYTQPWAYDPATDPKATLIGEVLTSVRSRIAQDGTALERLGPQLARLAGRVRWSRAIRLAAQTALTASLPKLSDLEDLFGKEDQVSEPTLEGFRADFTDLLVDEALETITRIVVVVDDLDRCLPPTVVDTLEAIKLFLAVPKMAFIVAADEGPVAHAISARFGTSKEGVNLATRYLEKIVQIPVRVPALGQADVEAYVAQLLLWHRLGAGEEFETVRLRCAESRSEGKDTLLSGLDEHLDDIALAERLAPILYEELEGNPRRIKRLLNAYWMRAAIAARRGVHFEVAAFAKLVLLEEVFPDDFGTLLGWLSAGTLGEQLASLEQGEGDFSASLRRWARLDPPLAELDVGGYLILAAALAGTTVTTSPLPPGLRELAAGLTSARDAERKAAQEEVRALGQDERSVLARHIADSIRFQPSRQADLVESLLATVGDSDEIASAGAQVLRRMETASVEPSLTINLVNSARNPFFELVRSWLGEEDLSDDTRRAARLALDSKS